MKKIGEIEIEGCKHDVLTNDEVEIRGISAPTREAAWKAAKIIDIIFNAKRIILDCSNLVLRRQE